MEKKKDPLKVLPMRFDMNGHATGRHPQTEKSEPPWSLGQHNKQCHRKITAH